MPHSIYQNATRDIGWQVYSKDRDTKRETAVTVVSGLFNLVGPSGEIIVPNSVVTITGGNKVTFRLRPSSGSALIGVFKETFDIFVGQESFCHEDTLTVMERF